MNKTILAISLVLLYFPVLFVGAMEPQDINNGRQEEHANLEVEIRKLYETGKAVRMALRPAQDGEGEKPKEKTIAKEQGAQIAVCLMRAPSSMPIPKKPN